ncbi:hypothetical protein [Leptotrichia shahii]|uniref:hypothetical protein n=1 Tax=Leptotrichia shahii TaxID=157691 RepID=UPI0028D5F272|nr:hypothetical protein [Leptotrichia shahii]
MKDFDKVMKKEMLDFKNEMLRHFFRDNFYDNFNDLKEYIENRINEIENRERETSNEIKNNHFICMTVMNEKEYKLNDNLFTVIFSEDFIEKDIKNLNMKDIMLKRNRIFQTIYMELTENEEKELKDRKFQGYIDDYNKKIPITFRLEKSSKYDKIIENLYYIFQKNGLEWKTVNSYYNDNFYNLIIDEYNREFLNMDEIYDMNYDLEEFEEKAKKDCFLVWNINRKKVNSWDYVLPYENNIVYRYKLDYKGNNNILVNHKRGGEYFSIYRGNDENINVLSDESLDDDWEIWEFLDINGIKRKESELKFKIHSNIQKNNEITILKRIRTRAEINRLFSSYETLDNIVLKDVGIETLKNRKYLKLKKLNHFIKYDFDLDKNLKQEIILKIEKDNIDKREMIKKMEYLVSELEYIYPEYIFKVVDDYDE